MGNSKYFLKEKNMCEICTFCCKLQDKLNPLSRQLKIMMRLVVVSYFKFSSLPGQLRSMLLNFGPRRFVCQHQGKALDLEMDPNGLGLIVRTVVNTLIL